MCPHSKPSSQTRALTAVDTEHRAVRVACCLACDACCVQAMRSRSAADSERLEEVEAALACARADNEHSEAHAAELVPGVHPT